MTNNTLLAKATITIHAPAAKVWEALTDPKLIKQYFFGSDIVTNWKVGSPILYKGIYEGKAYEDRGRVLQFEPEKLLVTTHWSPLSGTPDTPENYHTVRYELVPEGSRTHITLTQDHNATPEEQEQNSKNWQMVLDSLKKMME